MRSMRKHSRSGTTSSTVTGLIMQAEDIGDKQQLHEEQQTCGKVDRETCTRGIGAATQGTGAGAAANINVEQPPSEAASTC